MERRAADQLQLLTRVVARIADEIKNPLVSINAVHGAPPASATTTSPSAITSPRWSAATCRRLVQMFDKLAALVNEGDYKRDVVDIRVGHRGVPDRDGRGGDARRCPPTRICSSFTDDSTQKLVTVNFSHEGGAVPRQGRPRTC